MPATDYKPTVDEIGARIGARTLTISGRRLGTFNDETRPTAAIVSELIEDASAVVAGAVGPNIDSEYWQLAKSTVIAYVCVSIEIGFYPESTNAQDSAYMAFKARYESQLEDLDTALSQKRPNERRIVSIQQGTLVGVRGGRLDPWSNELFP